MIAFTLDPLIASTSVFIQKIDIFDLRMVNDSRYLWLLLIPRITGVTELSDLSQDQRHLMIDAASQIADIISARTNADKMNIATIGNIVPAMHLHIIARHSTDEAWPNPIWGNGAPLPMADDVLAQRQADVRHWLQADGLY